ncbi:hypothetical protein Pmani_023263 [Petrolisthes manimaculis]|uniref:PHD-type domain-containing protein n=1 Tax=Petrolisthes manimaculis TaxID=1843537 RepID=A0AAE1PAG6_9EUCA|nr:hypothetical protein Pmani_023263 [Petrolisthes manimaculis]
MAEKQGKKSSAPNRKDQPVSTTNKATITKTSAADEEDAVCVKCDKVVSAQDYAICCEICESWFHIACQKIPRPVYDYMVVEESGKQLHWNCSFCKHGYENMHRNLKRLEKQQEDITRKQEVIVAELCETKETVREKMEQVDTMENRTVSVELKHNHTKAEIFKNISNLKGKEEFQSIRIQHDLTKIERQHEALLRKEAKNRTESDSTGASNDETIIEDISVDTSLGKSDHGCISFYCDVEELQETNRKTIYMYEKADYDKIRQRLDVDWEKFFEADTDIEGKWTKFKEKILSAVEECVPKRIVKEGCTKRRLNKNLPMNRKLWNKIKRKQRLWEQMNKLENSENDMEKRQYADISKEYKRVNNQNISQRK